MAQFENLGLDMGNSGWKVGWKNTQIYLLNLITEGPIRDQVNGVFEVDYSNDSLDNIAINTDFGLRYVGNIAKSSHTPPWYGHGEERYLQPEFMQTMTLAAMSELRRLGQNPVVITTAIPAKWAQATAYHKGQDIRLVDAIKAHFGRDHTIDREGQRGQRTISVDEVRVLTETEALLFSFLLDKDGLPAIENYQAMRFAVVDIGELTTCIDVFSGLQREGTGITLTNVSMGKIHKATAGQVLVQTGRDFTHWEIRDIVRAGGQVMLPATGKRRATSFDVTPIYNGNVASSLPVLRSQFGDYITRPKDIHYIIVGGGGSEILGSALTDYYRQAQVVGQYATLQGLRNYGERLCHQKNQ
jgi:hypothetical protein